jgi:site-specific recombinase XerD
MSNKALIYMDGVRFLTAHELEPPLKTYVQYLMGRGFSHLTVRGYIESVSHFGTWLNKKKISINEIDEDIVRTFSKHRCYCPGSRRKHLVSKKYVSRVVRFLKYTDLYLHSIDGNSTSEVASPLLQHFRKYSLDRGLSPITIKGYEYSLVKILPVLGDNTKEYDAHTIRTAVCNIAKKCNLSATKRITSTLRVFLRFLAAQELCPSGLDNAVPKVPHWSVASMPRYINKQDIERLLNSFDLRTPQGIRDRAIVLLLVRLGLRAGDVTNMQLGDINWPEGDLTVTGKCKREDKLPLPQDVGDAILTYLKKVRPLTTLQHVFLCLNAPCRPLRVSTAISNIVDAALTRAGISNPPSRGAHLLRHSAATEYLRAGVTLETVSVILRHQSLDMTAYYAKVDISTLKKITQPWPEYASC